MGKTCSAYGCRSREGSTVRGKKLTWHRFPLKNPSLLKKWVYMVRRKDPITNKLWMPTSNSLLCSVHFEKPCLYTRGQQGSRVRLRPDAVPTIFNYSSESRTNAATKPATKAKGHRKTGDTSNHHVTSDHEYFAKGGLRRVRRHHEIRTKESPQNVSQQPETCHNTESPQSGRQQNETCSTESPQNKKKHFDTCIAEYPQNVKQKCELHPE